MSCYDVGSNMNKEYRAAVVFSERRRSSCTSLNWYRFIILQLRENVFVNRYWRHFAIVTANVFLVVIRMIKIYTMYKYTSGREYWTPIRIGHYGIIMLWMEVYQYPPSAISEAYCVWYMIIARMWLLYNLDTQWTPINVLTHWGRVTHICVSNLIIIGSDNGLSPGRRQATIRTNAGILLTEPLGTNFSENLIEIVTFSLTKMRLKVSSAKWRPFCPGLNVLTLNIRVVCMQTMDQAIWEVFVNTVV